MGAAYGQRPASYLGLDAGSREAYEVDLACLTVGRDVEARLHKKRPLPWQEKARPAAQGGFAALGARARKATVPEGGVW